jgi:type II secretory pathway pseudopilin PulG
MTPSQSFIENTIVLLLTAALTGVLVPYLFRLIDEQKNKEQKIFEAEISRQTKIIEAQVKLLEDLSNLIWEYQLLLIEVPYFRQFDRDELYPNAVKIYDENSGRLLGKIRAEISKALRLTPYSIYEELKKLYYDELLQVDLKVSQLATSDKKKKDRTGEWRDLNHYAVYELSEKVDKIIDKLACELNLKARTVKDINKPESAATEWQKKTP